MNAAEILAAARQEGVSVQAVGRRLVLSGSGARLSDELKEEIKRHKPEVLVSLGVPMDEVVGGILAELRPHLSPALRQLPDAKLLALVNWSIMAAWGRAIDGLSPGA